MIKTLFTIGYTGLTLDEFVEHLVIANVESLLDVREIPISRKRGFSKKALSDALAESGIHYYHFKWLGSPKALRHEVRRTRDYPTFFRGVASHLHQQSPAAHLEETLQLARRSRCCLMCCCEDWQFCHRRCIIDEILKKQQFRVVHLSEPVISKAEGRAA